jgi:enterochelin esterase-like enzyme
MARFEGLVIPGRILRGLANCRDGLEYPHLSLVAVFMVCMFIPWQKKSAVQAICTEKAGTIKIESLRSPHLTLPMEYRVYLPPCYEQQPTKRFPVLYLFHGSNYNDDQWDRLGVDETANRLIAQGEISPLIIVMPRDRNWADPTEDLFGRVVIEELIPLIDHNFRTLTERKYRAVGGLSRGAGWAVHLGLSHWELFGALGGHSLPVFWSDTTKIRGWLAEIPRPSLPRIYLDIGDKDRPPIMASAVWFEELLTQYGIPHEWYLFPGYHEEAYWQKHLPQYLRWYNAGW